jgi:hypothetical protein
MENAQSIEHWIASLEREIVEMDLSAYKAQVDLWKRFANHPGFPAAGTGVFDGWAPDRYLGWSKIEMGLHLKARKPSLWNRLKDAVRWVFSGFPPLAFNDLKYSLANSSDRQAIAIKIVFEKKDGKITSRMEY